MLARRVDRAGEERRRDPIAPDGDVGGRVSGVTHEACVAVSQSCGDEACPVVNTIYRADQTVRGVDRFIEECLTYKSPPEDDFKISLRYVPEAAPPPFFRPIMLTEPTR